MGRRGVHFGNGNFEGERGGLITGRPNNIMEGRFINWICCAAVNLSSEWAAAATTVVHCSWVRWPNGCRRENVSWVGGCHETCLIGGCTRILGTLELWASLEYTTWKATVIGYCVLDNDGELRGVSALLLWRRRRRTWQWKQIAVEGEIICWPASLWYLLTNTVAHGDAPPLFCDHFVLGVGRRTELSRDMSRDR